MARASTDGSDFYEALGRRIANLRKERSLSQDRLGEAAEVGTSYVAHIELGSRRPTLDVLIRIADALAVPLWQLITNDRMSHDELASDAATRDLIAKLRGLSQSDLRALSYLAERLGRAPVEYALRAAEPRGPRLKRPRKRT